MKVRKANIGDIPLIDKFYIKGALEEVKLQFPTKFKKYISEFKKYKRERLSGWKKDLKDKKQFNIILEDEGKIIGFASAKILPRKRGRLEFVYITKKFRGKGFAKKLTLLRMNWLKKNKIKDIEMSVYVKNKPSIILHEKLGFKKVSYKMVKEI